MHVDLKKMQQKLYILFLICLFPLSANSPWTPVPEDTLFPAPIADQNYPRFSISFPIYLQQRIDTLQPLNSISAREALEFGGAQSLFRYTPDAGIPFSMEISFGAGILTLFDTFEDNLENFGWEGSGFLALNLKVSHHMSMRFGFHHLSSHVGDEYLAKYGVIALPVTDQQDLLEGETYGMDYVRDSLMGGISYQLSPLVRLYAEVRYARDMLRYMLRYNDFPWQANLGCEFTWPALTTEGIQSNWYAALHATGYQETSWFPGTTLQMGYSLRTPGENQRLRIGLEYYIGRPQIAVFNYTRSIVPTTREDLQLEQYVAIGAWYDF